jgi:hypothetical protein
VRVLIALGATLNVVDTPLKMVIEFLRTWQSSVVGGKLPASLLQDGVPQAIPQTSTVPVGPVVVLKELAVPVQDASVMVISYSPAWTICVPTTLALSQLDCAAIEAKEAAEADTARITRVKARANILKEYM